MLQILPAIFHRKNLLCRQSHRSQLHSCWSHDEVDENVDLDDEIQDEGLIETNNFIGNNVLVKTFNQMCVICSEKDSVNEFRQCGHQFICEQYYQNKSDIDILKRTVCRT